MEIVVMKMTASDTRYSANYNGIRMQLLYNDELQCELRIKTHQQARQLLTDWARLKKHPAQILKFQELAQSYVGATVDDIVVSDDGESYFINGKLLETI